MRELGLDGLSEDGKYLLAHDPTSGEHFRIPADRRTASLIESSSRTGSRPASPEVKMESSLTPRDIQSRIRRGETTDEVADAAGVPVEQIMAFAGPVLAEREFMCEQARGTSLRRQHVAGSGVLLGDLVDAYLADNGGHPEAANWDSWRREDGCWTVLVTPEGADRSGAFLFDVKSRFVRPVDERAREFVGDVPLSNAGDMALADALAAAPPLADDQTPAQAGVHSLKEARDRKAQVHGALTDATPTVAREVEPVEPEPEPPAQFDLDELLEESFDVAAAPGAAADAERKKKHERRRVPSWDEIMFGGRAD